MKVLVQRVSRAEVRVAGRVVGRIDRGLLVLVGVERGDTERDVLTLAEKTVHLRVFDDEAGRMNRSLIDVGGSALVVSQFTLAGATRRGRRPSFGAAAPPEVAEPLVTAYVEGVRSRGVPVETGVFRAHMEVESVNDGPVTLMLDPPTAGAS